MEQNKTARYFKYAFGEIILVVIGILIALQVNDWNETNKQLKQESIYLIKLKEDILNIKDVLAYDIDVLPNQVLEAQQALYYIQQCNENLKGKEALENILITHGNLGTIFIRDATYTEMLSNGAFTRLSNDSLKTTIGNLYSRLYNANNYIVYFRDELGRASDIIWNHVDKEFKPNVVLDYRSQDQLVAKYNYNDLCKSGVFKNALVEVYDARQDVYGLSQFANSDIEEALQVLTLEIEKSK